MRCPVRFKRQLAGPKGLAIRRQRWDCLMDCLVARTSRAPAECLRSPLCCLECWPTAHTRARGRLADMLGRSGGTSPAPVNPNQPGGNVAPPASGGLGDMFRGGLGGLLAGGAAGGLLSGGLNDLLGRFQQSGHGDIAKSWIGTGENRAISPKSASGSARARYRQLARRAGRHFRCRRPLRIEPRPSRRGGSIHAGWRDTARVTRRLRAERGATSSPAAATARYPATTSGSAAPEYTPP